MRHHATATLDPDSTTPAPVLMAREHRERYAREQQEPTDADRQEMARWQDDGPDWEDLERDTWDRDFIAAAALGSLW